MPQVRRLADLRRHLGDLEWKSRTMPGYGLKAIRRQIAGITGDIADLERGLATPPRGDLSAFSERE